MHFLNTFSPALQKGAMACFLRDVPFSALYFPIYAYGKHFFQQRDQLSSLSLLLSATVAGVFSSGLTTPADVIKTRLQTKPTPGERPYAGVIDCARRMAHTEGFSSLFKGIGPRVIRSSPQYGIMLLCYELLTTLFGADEGFLEPDSIGGGFVKLVVEDKWHNASEWDPPAAFVQRAKQMQRISVGGGGNVWGINQSGLACKWTGFEWKTTRTSVKYLSVGADGTCCGIHNSSLLYWDPWRSRFLPLANAPPMHKVSVGSFRRIWGIMPDGVVMKYAGGGRWKQRGDVRMKHISVGSDGAVWGIERSTGSVYSWQSKENVWVKRPGQLRMVTVGGAKEVWGMTEDNLLVKFNFDRARWQEEGAQPIGQQRSISVAADGTLVSLGPNHAKIKQNHGHMRHLAPPPPPPHPPPPPPPPPPQT
eukprot:TRINITY_DN3373_c0_g1_i2.p1 TRINITY_DN3373_c0_g1~~TRINITY_DN3373_c0_g1_i2.p1  ORF type:complete len:420 (-),score=35.60 TRINITY_DN3373_c0_g1_i2:112-1371(-)